MPEDLAAKWHKAIKSVFQTGREMMIETEYPTPTGIKHYSNRLAPESAEDGHVETVLNIGRDITERKRMERRIGHLNQLLRATYDVSHLIARERDPDKLLKRTCGALIESRGYRHAWLLLLDGSRRVVATTEGGLGKDFFLMTDWLERCGLTVCGKKALRQPGVVATIDPSSSCADCPLANRYDGKVYGLLSCSVPNDYATDEEEQSLFQTVARDISFALYSIETEKRRKRAVNTLAKLAGMFSR
jgi:PAS domain-containing protein